ncbi:peptidylprolyl isomerase [Chthonobacter albigriseus]|uniref:peptidylprolyl isomerase n=1 Tax=Chthonobacter albigriseus TaxID=1683161 RepID=UPI0015EF1A7A|nr:peptidylprolyl isomerase [Chthonobacter albigriseus]
MTIALLRRAVAPLGAAALAALLASGAAFAADGEVLARVNGKDITKTEVDLAATVFGEQLQQVPENARQSIVLDALVEMHVIADAAEKDGLAESKTYKERMVFLTAQALRNTYIEEKIQNAVSEDELKARYEKDVAGYEPPEEVKASHILVKTEDEAKQVIKDLDAGGDFAKIASEKSLDPGSKATGGDLGYFGKGQMVPEFETAAFGQEAGAYTKTPVKTQFGFHVIKTVEKRKQPVPAFADVREQIAQVVQREKYQQVIGDLKKAATIEMLNQPAAPAEGAAPADPAAPAPAPAQ